jgi:hypothetical protein
VAFVAMLKAGIDTGVYGAVARLAPASCSPASSKGRWWGFSISAGDPDRRRPWRSGAAARGGHCVPGDQLRRLAGTGLVIGLAIGYIIILARKFTINQSDSTYGGRDDGAGNASGRLGPLIILSAMTASIPIGIGSLVGALLFYIWQKPITGGAILGAMLSGLAVPGCPLIRGRSGACLIRR